MKEYIILANTSITIDEIVLNSKEKCKIEFNYKSCVESDGKTCQEIFSHSYNMANRFISEKLSYFGGPLEKDNIGWPIMVLDKKHRLHTLIIKDISKERMILNYVGVNHIKS